MNMDIWVVSTSNKKKVTWITYKTPFLALPIQLIIINQFILKLAFDRVFFYGNVAFSILVLSKTVKRVINGTPVFSKSFVFQRSYFKVKV